MKNWNPKEIQTRINEILPEGRVITRHNKDGHFYEVRNLEDISKPINREDGSPNILGPVYPSVTGKIQVLKDQGLMNYKMNRAIDYFKNFLFGLINLPSMEAIDKACEMAGRVSQDILEDAGDIGTRIHNYREDIFNHWIKTGIRPTDFTKFIPQEDVDVRAISGIRALQSFCEDRDYIPIVCEKLVFSHEDKVAGTLDDLGLMRNVIREGIKDCDHEIVDNRCMKCDYKYRYEFVLMDIKTSNQLKDHYFFQVATYWKYFWKLVGVKFKPERGIIVQLSKENGKYKIEDLKSLAKLAQYSRYLIKTNEAVDFIKTLRKDNQKVVAPMMQL